MNRTSVTRHGLILLGFTAVTAVAVVIGVRLDAYGVPLVLLLACAFSLQTSLMSLLFRLVDALSSTTHRCSRPGCDFQVWLTGVDAAENRRWQEIAGNHPHRTV
ncbi:hypothetical protein GCM10010260_31860 [Streptomyces filipinensis]|uniref:Uncharacterized protein n=1 Tax=Streptomyces filipinensis TaxID=66887 RepID=A0A918IAD5_9ACTN|nr:hypothetical protein [Streptomyces filipinensis]GGU94416.1 hypothetical protein GCM10010260_31860 [Streptomyces filipinensis]